MIKTNYSHLFAEATVDVLATFLEEAAQVGEMRESGSVTLLGECIVFTGLTGALQGRFLLEFNTECALALCQAMNFGEEFSDLDDFALATLAELANLAGGRAVSILNNRGVAVSLTPPTVLCGSGMRAIDICPTVILPVHTVAGDLNINVSIHEMQ